MATADEYATWIVNNADKKGTPEFDTVAQAYQQAKAIPVAASASTSLTTGQRLATGAMKGMLGGPLGAVLGATQEATNIGNEGLGKLAYDAGGKVTDITGSPALGFATNVATQAAPALVGGKIAGMLASPAMESGATRLMQSALKPTIRDLKTGKAATAIQTMLNEGVNVTPGGVMKLKSKIADLNNEIASAISGSSATVDKSVVDGPIQQTLDRFSKQVNPNADITTIKKAWDEFINHPLFSGSTMPVQSAQEMKQVTGSILGQKNAYGQMGTADVEAQKALVRGLKEGVASAVPEVSGLNASESKLLDALKVNERRVLISANKNPMGLSLISANPQAWAAFMADKSEMFKSLLARIMYSGSERIPQAIVSGGIVGATGITPNGLFGQPQPALLNPQQR